VALPMDEQRILEEMERMLAADDPRLAARLAAFGQPGFGQVLHTRRARATLSLMALVIIAAVAAVIYMMSAFRLNAGANAPRPHHQLTHVARVNPACAATYSPGCADYSIFLIAPGAARSGSQASTPGTSGGR
jgi:hypothetical protein